MELEAGKPHRAGIMPFRGMAVHFAACDPACLTAANKLGPGAHCETLTNVAQPLGRKGKLVLMAYAAAFRGHTRWHLTSGNNFTFFFMRKYEACQDWADPLDPVAYKRQIKDVT